jgi:NAD(P)H-quinone oxidoreductase subunit 3
LVAFAGFGGSRCEEPYTAPGDRIETSAFKSAISLLPGEPVSPAWIAALTFFAVVTAVAVGPLLAAYLMRVRSKHVPPTQGLTYECGEEPDGLAWIRFHPRYYVVALTFVVFDVEAAFMLPWALNVGDLRIVALVEMVVFVGILMLGWAYAVRKGALTWQ